MPYINFSFALHNFFYIKVIRQFGCFMEHLLTRETIWWTTPNKYNVEGDNKLPTGLQWIVTRLTTGSVLKITFPIWFHNCIF